MTPSEYKSLPANLQRDVRVALACGYGWERIRLIRHGPVYQPLGGTAYYSYLQVLNHPERGDGPMSYRGWQDWQPTTDTTIWTALMDVRHPSNGFEMGISSNKDDRRTAWYGSDSASYTSRASKGEAVCACFVAADPLGHLGRAGV